MRVTRPLVVLAASLITVGGCKPGPEGGRPDARPNVIVPPLPPPTRPEDLARVFPVSDAGRPILAQGHGVRLKLARERKIDPISGRGICMDLVSNCSEANSTPKFHALDDCFAAVPACTSAEPWVEAEKTPCCPRSCVDAYQAARRAGKDALDAIQHAFGVPDGAPDCYPGVDERVGR